MNVPLGLTKTHVWARGFAISGWSAAVSLGAYTDSRRLMTAAAFVPVTTLLAPAPTWTTS